MSAFVSSDGAALIRADGSAAVCDSAEGEPCCGVTCDVDGYRPAKRLYNETQDCTNLGPVYVFVPDCTECLEVCFGVCYEVGDVAEVFGPRSADCPPWIDDATTEGLLDWTDGPSGGVPIRVPVQWDTDATYAVGDVVLIADASDPSTYHGWRCVRPTTTSDPAPVYDAGDAPFFGSGGPLAKWFYVGSVDAACLPPPIGPRHWFPSGAIVFDEPDACGCDGCGAGRFIPADVCPGNALPNRVVDCDEYIGWLGREADGYYGYDDFPVVFGTGANCHRSYQWEPGATAAGGGIFDGFGTCCTCDDNCTEPQGGCCCPTDRTASAITWSMRYIEVNADGSSAVEIGSGSGSSLATFTWSATVTFYDASGNQTSSNTVTSGSTYCNINRVGPGFPAECGAGLGQTRETTYLGTDGVTGGGCNAATWEGGFTGANSAYVSASMSWSVVQSYCTGLATFDPWGTGPPIVGPQPLIARLTGRALGRVLGGIARRVAGDGPVARVDDAQGDAMLGRLGLRVDRPDPDDSGAESQDDTE